MRVADSLAPYASGRSASEDARTRSARAPDADGQPLGIYAKTYSPPTESPLEAPLRGYDHRKTRAERYALKSVVNRLLPTSRTSKCMRWTVPDQNAKIHRSIEHGKAFFGGLQVCASVWACPVCAAKISERRRLDLVSAIASAKAMEMQVYLLTLTIPHGAGDDLVQILDLMLKAWSKTNQGKTGQKIKALIGLKGMIRALEVTHGKNGFHPHLHVLLFLQAGLSPASVQNAFGPLWQNACEKVGLPRPSDLHGCKVSDGSYAAAYASKWGLESEMTRTHTKKGKPDSKTPWDFLRDVFSKRDGHEKSAALFRLYADTFKGKRQLYWSNGLRKLLALAEAESDEEIAEKLEDSARLMAELSSEQWDAIIRTESESLILDIAEKRPEKLDFALSELCGIFRDRHEKIACSNMYFNKQSPGGKAVTFPPG